LECTCSWRLEKLTRRPCHEQIKERKELQNPKP